MDSFDLYPFLEWIHIVNAAVLFGAGIGSAFHMWQTHKTGNVEAIAVAARNTVRLDHLITMPAAVIQPVTGVLMIVFVGFPWDMPWLIVSYVLYLMVGLFWLPVLISQKKAMILAQQAVRDKKPLPPEYNVRMNTWFRFGGPLVLSLFIIFFLMVHKPDFWLYW